MVVSLDVLRDHDHLKRSERCSRLAGSVREDSANEIVGWGWLILAVAGNMVARAEEAIPREGA
jgi:hypothetical protein